MARGSSEAIAASTSLGISTAIGRYAAATAAHPESALITASQAHEDRPIRSSRAAHVAKSRSQRSAVSQFRIHEASAVLRGPAVRSEASASVPGTPEAGVET
jgi:hypothetical protein